MSRIKVTYFDALDPMLGELVTRNEGFVKEGLQKSSSIIADGIKSKMGSFMTYFSYRKGKYGKKPKFFYDPKNAKKLGTRRDPYTGRVISPASMDSQVHFYVPKGDSGTAVIGGSHKEFQPRAYDMGIDTGAYGKPQKAVGSKGRAILHKLNTGEVTAENPHYGDGFMEHMNFVKNRNFYEKGFGSTKSAADQKIAKVYQHGFTKTIDNIEVTPRKRG